MVLFSLGGRLALCAEMVRPQAALADVGTDHAYLPVWLAKRGMISRAVASDIRPGPLERAKQNIERYGVGSLVTARLSDGLDAVSPDEADDVVIAGMGGLMMIEIIRRAEWLRDDKKRLILQPMTHADDLRRFLSEQGFATLQEKAVFDEGHIYSIMLCAYRPQECAKDELYAYIGRLTGDTKESQMYLHREMKRLQNRAGGLRLQGDEKKAAELFHIRERIAKMFPDGENGKG